MVSSDFRTHGFIRSSISFPTIYSPFISARYGLSISLSTSVSFTGLVQRAGEYLKEPPYVGVRCGGVGGVGGLPTGFKLAA
jgi:hypothetical protein